MFRLIFILLFLPFLVSCQSSYKIDSPGILIEERLFSPDSSYVAITFSKDRGALSNSLPLTAILKVKDTTGVITEHTLPCFQLDFYSCYFPDKWLDNNTLQVFLNERPFTRGNVPFESKGFKLNGVQIQVIPSDLSYSKSPFLQGFSFSPDKKRLLVAYGYEGDLNISVINYGDQLPRIGNISTNYPVSWNPIRFGKWNGEAIDLIMRDAEMYEKENYLNKGIAVPVNFVDVDRVSNALKNSDWETAMLYNDSYIDELLNTKGRYINAKIVDAITEYRGPGGEKEYIGYGKEYAYQYEYEYYVDGASFRSNFTIYKTNKPYKMYNKGDTIKIIYDPKQPLIHRTGNNYSR